MTALRALAKRPALSAIGGCSLSKSMGKDNRWTKRCAKWQPRSGRRDRGRPEARWMAEESTRSEEMEDICRGLHPAVDGQNLQKTK
ncbi:hypothetical protein PoB_004594100 [Plakobranchus ocellatus]|uniref:Uncharacterized protein n=1 Tax=Plakobranchus ocellatus TaxID=259542 RepID=A0AAV4B7S9_9GAST|nr:hypothetical protein PoB_004594100 [Plakobranchus ocellatus]